MQDVEMDDNEDGIGNNENKKEFTPIIPEKTKISDAIVAIDDKKIKRKKKKKENDIIEKIEKPIDPNLPENQEFGEVLNIVDFFY